MGSSRDTCRRGATSDCARLSGGAAPSSSFRFAPLGAETGTSTAGAVVAVGAVVAGGVVISGVAVGAVNAVRHVDE